MQQPELFFAKSGLFDHLCDADYLHAGFRAVKKSLEQTIEQIKQ